MAVYAILFASARNPQIENKQIGRRMSAFDWGRKQAPEMKTDAVEPKKKTRAKLTREIVQECWQQHMTDPITHTVAKLAARHGVTRMAMHNAINRTSQWGTEWGTRRGTWEDKLNAQIEAEHRPALIERAIRDMQEDFGITAKTPDTGFEVAP
jgi:hypothetical protein